MEIHAAKVNQGVECGRFLAETREKTKRSSYKCREFANDLHSVFAINTGNYIMGTGSPTILLLPVHTIQVMDRYNVAKEQHTPYTVSITHFDWNVHTAVDCKAAENNCCVIHICTCKFIHWPFLIMLRSANQNSHQKHYLEDQPT